MTEKEKLDYLESQGINANTGLRYADDSMEFYEQLIGVFLEEYTGKLIRVKKEYENKGEEYTVLVHGLKNNAKALGAEKLAELAYAHEQASRKGDWKYIAENLEELLGQWQSTVQIFQNLNN